MARLRNAPSTQAPAPAPATRATRGRPALKEKTNTTRPSTAPVYEDDGNTEDLIKDAKPRRGRPKKRQQPSDELLMTSGLGLKDGAVANQDSEAPTTTDELAKGDDAPVAIAKPNRRSARSGRKVVHNEQQSKVLEGLKQRMEATAKGQRANTAPKAVVETAAPSSDTMVVAHKSSDKAAEQTVERSDFSLSPSPPPPGKLTTARRPSVVQSGSALKLQNTPAVEASMLALKNFKRRPRQPSMLQMVQQRTASARPSLANTAAAETTIENTSVFDLDISDNEDDFAPEAEGTPLKVTKAQRRSSTKTKLPDADEEYKSKPSAKKRKSTDNVSSMVSLSSSRSKRRKSTRDEEVVEEVFPAASKDVAAPPSSSARAATPLPAQTSDVQVINSPSTSTPPTEPSSTRHRGSDKEDEFAIPSTEREEPLVLSSPTPELEDQADDPIPSITLAEPLSSSPASQDPKIMDSFAEPITQISPQPAKPQTRKKVKPLTTSVLQSLLPKRRAPEKPRRRKTEYDLESDSDGEGSQLDTSHLEDDEDELGGAMRRKKATPLKNAKKGRQGKGATVRGSSKAPTRKPTAASKTKKAAKTYGRVATSDKENEDYESADEAEDSILPEVSVSMQDASLSKELEDAKKKFAEVDEFDMEFESMSNEHHRSSSQDWR